MDTAVPRLTPATRWAFFLDFDGTLADIAAAPEAVILKEFVRDTLARLAAATDGAVAVISGRPIADIDRFLTPLHVPVAGLHGLEWRGADGQIERVEADSEQLEMWRHTLKEFVAAHPGTLLEDKGLALALHFRGAPDAEPAVCSVMQTLVNDADPAFVLQKGKMVREIRPAGGDKGTAIRAFMDAPPFHGRVPVFIGDDVTDEAGFAVVNKMHGISVRVGAPAETNARYTLANVEALHDWLDDAADTLSHTGQDAPHGER